MKQTTLKWRLYEVIFVTGMFIAFLVREITDARSVILFLLTLGTTLLVYAAVSIALRYRAYFASRPVLSIVLVLCAWVFLSVSYSVSIFERWISLLDKFSYLELRVMAGKEGIKGATLVLVIYAVYLAGREGCIRWLESSGVNRTYRLMVADKAIRGAFSVVAIIILGFYIDPFDSSRQMVFFIFGLIPFMVVNFINVYGIFPNWKNWKETGPKLLIAPTLIALVEMLIFHLASDERSLKFSTGVWAALILIGTPLSWTSYLSVRSKIKNLLKLQQDLGTKTADLDFLRSQLNPHFLFNILNTLYGTALQEGAPRTAEGTQRLGDMMRFMLHDNQQDLISLNRELEYIGNFISLQNLRLVQGDLLRIDTSIDSSACEGPIAPMLLIPFIENAYKHGIRNTAASFILLKIWCEKRDSDTILHLDLINSLHPTQNDEEAGQHSGIGLSNVKQRLQLLYPGKHRLQVAVDDAAWQVRLQITL